MIPATDAAARALGVAIDFKVFDAKCREQGAADESARAELVGVSRVTLWRWRKGKQQVSLPVASQIADRFGITVDQLTGRAA